VYRRGHIPKVELKGTSQTPPLDLTEASDRDVLHWVAGVAS
jgi:hypothetical protein